LNNNKVQNLYFDLTTYISLISNFRCSTKSFSSLTNGKRLTKVERSKLKIESPLNEVIIGLLLSDGYIQQRSLSGNSRFIYGQSSLREHYLNYFYHVYELFKPYISENFSIKPRSFIDKNTKKTYSSVSFATLTLPCFTYYRNLFYNTQNKKVIPSNISELLTPRGLAYWIMDNGSIQNKGLHLNTYAFAFKEVNILKELLENMFIDPKFFCSSLTQTGPMVLKCSIHKHKKGYRIYIWEESMIIIKNHISQYMHKDMLYKIGIQ